MSSRSALAIACLALAAVSRAQGDYGTLFFKANVGSFKILGNVERPAEGRLEMSFTGTVLVSGDANVQVSGDVRREYFNERRKKRVFHGKGRIVVDGKFPSVQWFGRQLDAKWTGWGVVRLYGEYDKDLNTGTYWYSDIPEDKQFWGTFGKEVRNPPERPFDPRAAQPKRRPQTPPRR